ncbi:MAG: hypothetical protein ACLVJU_03730 [Blautia sp.]|jgi:hypothetical protein
MIGEIIMREHFIKFIDEDVDGCGTDVTIIARVYGNDITVGTIDRIKDAICNYKNENEGEWDTDGCLAAAQEQLEMEGYEVYWINTCEAEICF